MKTSVEILLDNDLYDGKSRQPTYTAGQGISGRVVYMPAAQKKVEEVTILLLGRCSTVVRCPDLAGFGKDLYAEEIEMFRLKRTLLTGPFTMQATTTEWRFAFVLPTKTAFVRAFGGDNWLYETQPHQLPPSTSSAGQGHKAVVTYSLRVVVDSGHLRGSEAWNLPIAVTTCSDQILPQPESVRCALEVTKQTIIKLPGPEKVNLRQKMVRAFSKDTFHHPSCPYDIVAYMPDAANISQPMSVSISARPNTGSDKVAPLSLLQANLELIAKVHVRVKTRMGDIDEKIWEEYGQHPLVDSPSPVHANGHAMELSNSVRLADLVQEEVRQRM